MYEPHHSITLSSVLVHEVDAAGIERVGDEVETTHLPRSVIRHITQRLSAIVSIFFTYYITSITNDSFGLT